MMLCYRQDLEKLHQFRHALMDCYEMKDLGEINWFLGIRIIQNRQQRKLWLSQDSYIEKITKTFHLEDRTPPYMPTNNLKLMAYNGKASPQDIYRY